VPTGTGQKNGRASRSKKSGDGLSSVMDKVSPAARSPEMCEAVPSRKARSPSMSSMTWGPGGFATTGPSASLGDSARSME
jgi:hypothetical protein